jgi:molybdenum cofactor cytidylyltransferase
VIVGIILAAGLSRRLGRPKQLLSLGGEPLIRKTIRQVLASSLDQTILVVGELANEIEAAVSGLPVHVVVNRHASLGQSTSIRAGLAALPPDTKAAVFVLGDQPEIEPGVIDALIASWRAGGSPVVLPQYAEGIGNPVLFDRRLFPELAAIDGDVGARAVVLAHRATGDLEAVPVDVHTPADVDTEADFRALLDRLQSNGSIVKTDAEADKCRE